MDGTSGENSEIMFKGRITVPRCERMTEYNRVAYYSMAERGRNGQKKAGKQEKKHELNFLTKKEDKKKTKLKERMKSR